MPKVFVYHSNVDRMHYLVSTIQNYYEKVGRPQRVEHFTKSMEAAMWLQKNGKFVDILFLDCTNQSVAVSLAKLVRNDNLRASWVYVDGTIDGLCDTLLLRPSAYLKDSADIKQIAATIQRLDHYHQALQRKHDFVFKYEGDYVHIPFSNICYFESSAKKVTLHLRDRSQTYYFTAKLEEIHKRLPDTFLRCHQSYLVNLEEIRRLDSREHLFILNNNDDVLISRRMYTAAKERYEQFLEERQKKETGLSEVAPNGTEFV